MSRHSRANEPGSRRSRRRAQEEPSITEWLDSGSYGPYAADSNRGLPEEPYGSAPSTYDTGSSGRSSTHEGAYRSAPASSGSWSSTYDRGTTPQSSSYDGDSGSPSAYGVGSYGTASGDVSSAPRSADHVGSYGTASADVCDGSGPSAFDAGSRGVLSQDVFSRFRSTYEASSYGTASRPSVGDEGSYGTASPDLSSGSRSGYETGSQGSTSSSGSSSGYDAAAYGEDLAYRLRHSHDTGSVSSDASYGSRSRYDAGPYGSPSTYDTGSYRYGTGPSTSDTGRYQDPRQGAPATSYLAPPSYERPTGGDRYRSIGGVADPGRPAPGEYGPAAQAGPPMADYLTRPPLPEPAPPREPAPPPRRPGTPIPSAARSRKAPKDPPPPPVNRAGRLRLRINPITCDGHGICAELLPELVSLDDWGYPMPVIAEVPTELEPHAQRAAQQCPTLAIILERRQPRPR